MRCRFLPIAVGTCLVMTLGPAYAFEGFLKTKVSALRVMTSQIATASKAQINASLSVAQAEMAARGVLASTVEQLRLYQDFSATNGQGAQVCDAVSQRNDIDNLAMARDKYLFTAMPNAGRSPIPPDEYPVVRAERQMDAYCSAEEHNLGLCRSRFDGMANGSSNFNKLQTQDQFTSKQLKAARDYVENLVPRQALPVQRGSNCDASCQSARLAAMRADATASMIATSMAMQLANRIGEKTFAEKK